MASKGNAKNIAEKVKALIDGQAEKYGCTLWDVTFSKVGSQATLLIEIDKEGGVSIDDCKAVNDAIEPIIDRADPIDCSYTLELAGAGLERDLRNDAHFDFAVKSGWDVTVKAFGKIFSGSNIFTGKLLKFDNEFLYFDGIEPVARRDIARAVAADDLL